MERISSVDDIVGTFWNDSTVVPEKAGIMNRSASEWAFQEFLKESLAAANANATPGPLTRRRAASRSRFLNEERPDAVAENDGGEEQEQEEREDGQRFGELNPKPNLGFQVPLIARIEELRALNNVVDVPENDEDEDEDEEDAAAVNGALNPLFSGLRDDDGDNINNQVANNTNTNTDNNSGDCPQEYEHFLKHKLEMACAAVAFARGNAGGAQGGQLPAAIPQTRFGTEYSSATSAHKARPTAVKSSLLRKAELELGLAGKARPLTSGSELSDDEDQEELNNLAPGDLKRVKRMISNRESARRSRRRKQAHLCELEAQVAQLRVENSTLVQRLQEISQKFQEAAVDNRVLKADVGALRAKVKMAQQDAAARQGHHHPAGNFYADPADYRYMVGGDGSNYMQQVRWNPMPQEDEQQYTIAGKMGRTPSMQRVASLEHLQKRVRSGLSCNAPSWGNGWEMEGPTMVEQHDM